MPMEDTYGIQSRIGSIIVVERWYCCRGSPVFSDRNIQKENSLMGQIANQMAIELFVKLKERIKERNKQKQAAKNSSPRK